ncbi:MAG: hypothetical protein IH800_15530 [Myxococcales bacterium]|nr:hypothetical protein [Myxococcales bacterium]
MIDRMLELIGEPERVWVALPLPTGERERPWDRIQSGLDRVGLDPEVGLIYMADPLPLP